MDDCGEDFDLFYPINKVIGTVVHQPRSQDLGIILLDKENLQMWIRTDHKVEYIFLEMNYFTMN